MTAINYYETPTAGHIFTDAAIYDAKSAKVLGFTSKVFPIPRYSAAIASCGAAWVNQVLAEGIQGADFKTFDELAANYESHIKAYMRFLAAQVSLPWGNFQSLLVGWSESADAPAAFVMRGDRGCQVERITNFQMPVVDKTVQFDAADPVASGIRLMSKQRAKKFYPQDHSIGAPVERVSGVGGFILHAKLTREGLLMKQVHHWPEDELGKVLTPGLEEGVERLWEPEPIDWMAFNARRAAELAARGLLPEMPT